MYCQHCGAEITTDDRYCQGCGAELGDSVGAGDASGSAGGETHERTGEGSGGQYQPRQAVSGTQYQRGPGTRGGRDQGGAHVQGRVQQEARQSGGHPSHGGRSGTLVVRTKADKYLRRFSRFNLGLAIFAAFFGVLALLLQDFVESTAGAPPAEVAALFGFVYVLLFGLALLYAAIWYFAKRRSTIAVYGATAMFAIGTVVNAATFNLLAFPVSLLGAYWGYRSFGAV